MVVMKFGGTSVENAVAIKRVIDIVKKEPSKNIIVFVSACSGVTNDLIKSAQTVKIGDKDKSLNILDRLRNRHKNIAEELLIQERYDTVSEIIDDIFQELRNLVRGVYLIGELSDRSLDTFTSYGERLSSLIIHAAMENAGINAHLVDIREVMITDTNYGAARPITEKINKRANEILLPILESDRIIITQGFIGSTEEGITTTIGRGGSDFSAAIIGSVLNAENIQIWTDVDGMMSADPRIIPEAKLIKEISFDEASELAYFGAKVLHPNTIFPAVQKNIPVRILNSRKPEIEGTLILKNPASDDSCIVKSIASKSGISVVNVTSSRMLLAHGFLAKLFSIFADHEISIDVVSTSEVSVSLTLDNDEGLDAITEELENIGDIKIVKNKAIVCIVGEGIKQTHGMAARIFKSLANSNINIEMISQGASEINLTLVIDDKDINNAVKVLHDELFGKNN